MFWVFGEGFGCENAEPDTDRGVVEVMDGAFDLSGRDMIFSTGCTEDKEGRVWTVVSFGISGEEDIVNGVFHLDRSNG